MPAKKSSKLTQAATTPSDDRPALIYVPQRRPPSAARAWLLLIFFLPWVGLLLYLLIGRAYMPRRRFKIQRQIYQLIRRIAPRAASFDASMDQVVSAELLPALRRATSTLIPSLVFSAHPLSPRTAGTVTAALLKSKTSNEQLVQRVRQLLHHPAGPAKPEAAKV